MNQDPHRWKTPQMPRGLPPTAWPQKRRAMWVEALQNGRQDVPRPVHAPGECRECDRMREIVNEAGLTSKVFENEEAPRTTGPATPRGFKEMSARISRTAGADYEEVEALGTKIMGLSNPPGSTPLDRIGNITAFPGTVALVLGMMAGIGLCTIVGPAWGVGIVMVLFAFLCFASL